MIGSQPDTAVDTAWRLHTPSRQPWLRAYLGNGNIAAQLVAEGGLAGGERLPLHLMAGLYDRAAGREVEHPASLPGWNYVRLHIGGTPLLPEEASEYGQELHLRDGLAETHHRWQVNSGSVLAVTVQAVLRHQPSLALIRLTLGATMACEIDVTADLDTSQQPALRAVTAGAESGCAWVEARTLERGIPLAVAATLFDDRGHAQHSPASAHARVALEPNRPCTLTWLVAVHSGRTAADPRPAALADLRRAREDGPDRLLAGHAAAWHALWQADVQVEGESDVQRFVRAGLFALLCSIREDVPSSIAPMGLSSMGYIGHIFWDADTWMFPPLLLLHPDLARGMLTYRQDRLPAAKARAQAQGYDGAMFPWESATDGTDVTPLSLARTGLKEHHITACVAIAHWQYYLATGDRAWLAEKAWPVLEAAARFWASRVLPGARGYEIHDAIAADEYAEDIDNNAFTNAAARAALLAALAAARDLRRPAPHVWHEVADGLVLARDGDLVLEFDGYDGRLIKQADVELLTFPLEHPLGRVTIECNLETYRRVTDPEGPAMSRCISAIVAAQLGKREDARSLFAACYEPHLWGPFYALAETRSNGEVSFVTGVGGALQSLLFGFAGLRLHRDCLALDPLLPSGWQALRFPTLRWRGATCSLAILPGDRAELTLQDAVQPCTVVLQRWRPGPEPLTVEVRLPGAVSCGLEAADWRVEPVSAQHHAWRLWPSAAEPVQPFVHLRLTLTGTDGTQQLVELEQRVRSGDDRPA